MQEDQEQNRPVDLEEDETGLAGLVVPAPADNGTGFATPEDAVKAGYTEFKSLDPPIDPLAADRAARVAAIRAEAAAKEAEAAKAGKPFLEPTQPSAALLAAQEERAAVEMRANSAFKVSNNAQEVLPSWEEVVAKRQEDARIRRHQKELDERESNQAKKEEFKARVLAARQPETVKHRPQPTAPAISAQTLAEMEAGRRRSEEFGRARGAVVMPVIR